MISLYVWKGVSAWALGEAIGAEGGEGIFSFLVQMLRTPEIEEWAAMEQCAMVHLTRCWVAAKEAGSGGKEGDGRMEDWIENVLSRRGSKHELR